MSLATSRGDGGDQALQLLWAATMLQSSLFSDRRTQLRHNQSIVKLSRFERDIGFMR
jgi:hypothetical protein